MNYQPIGKLQSISEFPLVSDFENEPVVLADNLRAEGHALFRVRCLHNNSATFDRHRVSSLSSTIESSLETEFASSIMKAIFSDNLSRNAILHPWVWDSDRGAWVNVDEIKCNDELEFWLNADGLSIAMFAINSGVIADALILHDVPWKLMSSEYEAFHSRAIGILTDGTMRENKTVEQSLSASERNCLVWCACGKTSHEISEILSLSEHTVNHYFSIASSKLGVVNRAQAVAKAIKNGLIGLDEIR